MSPHGHGQGKDHLREAAAALLLWAVVGCGNAGPTDAPASVACRPTLPNGDTPPGEDAGPRWYGNGRLYTGLSESGETTAGSRSVAADGSISAKFGWWRAPNVGVAGDLEITGHEIGTGATITASIPEGYGQRFQASGITFPAEGCYEITARSGDAELSFVTKVTVVRSPAASQ